MGVQNSPRSFNTVIKSNREQRAKRHRRERTALLSICTVIILILLTLIVLLICSIADAFGANAGGKLPGNTPGETDTGDPAEADYVQITWESSKVNNGVLLVVNDDHFFDPATVTDLIDMKENRTQINGANPYQLNLTLAKQMHAEAFSYMEKMMQKYYEISDGDGSVMIKYAYRTLEDQAALPSSSVEAGYSDHHTGCCIALHDGSTPQNPPALSSNHWIYYNCHKFGFIQRYPVGKESATGVDSYEHCFRYVGIPHATYITSNGLCLEEYVELLKSTYTANNRLSITGADGIAYEVYYVPVANTELTTISVPRNGNYSISGDNIGGFIVTVNLGTPNA